ncbi:ATP-binding cassette domain-containing protein [Corynebacterium oculi]|uniref:Putative HMP/thiamine import ATP-binding protein YkoD n=1 Tax=Corynebacterium oculi TaxID=1544416 RepID=A0A0Q0YMQ5_9CORY|nr:ATP-binding cassette domain-containing protein [Corynebacterium oculi]KQB83757.1 putative HMP/thiamine import ATP-binding protein YkoD [Corynebacterium oculi]
MSAAAGELAERYLLPGRITQVVGDSGSGLTTLAREVTAAQGAGVLVAQDVEGALSGLRETVREEVAFGLEQRGVSRERMSNAVEEVLARLGLSDLAWANPETLSGGQTRRLALARTAVLAAEDTTGITAMICDDPLAGLDAQSRRAVVRLCRDLARRGRALLLVGYEAAPELPGPVLWWDGAELHDRAPQRSLTLPPSVAPGSRRERFRGVQVRRGERFRSGPHDLSVLCGGVTWVRGPNGAGKTSLLRAIAGLDGGSPTVPTGRVALAVQCSRDQVLDTQAERMVGRARVCERWGIDPQVHPLDLGASDLRCVQVLGAAELGRRVLALDEPDVGCDGPGKQRLHQIVAEYIGAGMAVVMTCHDSAFMEQVARYAQVETYDL